MVVRPEDQLRKQWQNPSDILSVLLIIGGNIIHKALAQLSGGYIVPVAFSFGWVAYSFEALLAAIGDNRLMPAPDCPSIVVHSKNGFVRSNQSWILGRILRDYESPIESGLRVSIFYAKEGSGYPAIDWVWLSGIAAIVVQLVIAAIPCILHRNWTILLVTAIGTILALSTGALQQWGVEKWACRRNSRHTVSLTRGNGGQHVMVIIGNGVGLNLEDLAGGRQTEQPYTRLALALLATFWMVLLTTVAGLGEDKWVLLVVGFVGMVQNTVAAGARRDPSAFGVPLQFVKAFDDTKIMPVLMETEESFPSVGASLVPVFFPGELRVSDKEWWARKATTSERTPAIEAALRK